MLTEPQGIRVCGLHGARHLLSRALHTVNENRTKNKHSRTNCLHNTRLAVSRQGLRLLNHYQVLLYSRMVLLLERACS